MTDLRIDGLDELRADLRGGSDRLAQSLSAAIMAATLLLQREIKERTPVGATGVARASFIAEMPQVLGDQVIGRVESSAAHIVPLELGTVPHWAPLAPLVDWVRSKLDVGDEAQAESIARKIQFAIAARGTRGYGMVHLTFKYFEGQVGRMLGEAVGRAL